MQYQNRTVVLTNRCQKYLNMHPGQKGGTVQHIFYSARPVQQYIYYIPIGAKKPPTCTLDKKRYNRSGQTYSGRYNTAPYYSSTNMSQEGRAQQPGVVRRGFPL